MIWLYGAEPEQITAHQKALAKAIRTVLADPTLARNLATAGRAQLLKGFSAEVMVQRTTQIYHEILSPHTGSSNLN
jgi:glycosyltransferase involved in cell wall biosynthesis